MPAAPPHAELKSDPGLDVFNELMTTVSGGGKHPYNELMAFAQHIKRGDGAQAQESLAGIREYLEARVNSVQLTRYVCYEILNAYTRVLKQSNLPLDNQELKRLLNFEDFHEFFTLLRESVEKSCGAIQKAEEASYERYRKSIVDFVDAHFTNPGISLIWVADHFNISIYTLSRIFKESSGIGFKEYIIVKRIELAKQLLLTTDLSIKEISERLGFGSAAYFAQIFKSVCGIAPSKFK